MVTITRSKNAADIMIPCHVEKSLVHKKNAKAPTLSKHDQTIITYSSKQYRKISKLILHQKDENKVCILDMLQIVSYN